MCITIIATTLFQEAIHVFWLGLKSRGEFYKFQVVYRELQLLNTLCNQAQQKCLSILIATAILFISTNLALLIRLGNGANLFVKFAFGTGVIDSASALLLTLGCLTFLHQLSKNVLLSVKQVKTVQRGILSFDLKLSRRFWKSCGIIKINLVLAIIWKNLLH